MSSGKRTLPDQLRAMGLSQRRYLQCVRHVASTKGFRPSDFALSKDGTHKIEFQDTDGSVVKFGKAGMNDFIMYTWKEHRGDVVPGTARKRQRAYHARFNEPRSHARTSPYNLSLNILW